MKKLLTPLLIACLLLCGCSKAQAEATAPTETRIPGHAVEVPETQPSHFPTLDPDPDWISPEGWDSEPADAVESWDLTTMRGCQLYAAALSEEHGVVVHVGEDVMAVTPWDYDLEPETDVLSIGRELQLLERRLSNYPGGMLQTLSQEAGELHISLVRGIYGKPGLGGIPSAAGLQYDENGVSYIALAASQNAEYTLYHELCHILDNYILENTQAYDNWDRLNPPEFTYDNDYILNQSRDGSAYLQEDTRCFIDTYSMSFPTEDRARIMEYAMTPDHEFLFQSPFMQRKLITMAQAIREAFGLENSARTYLWEQYIDPNYE